MTYNDKISNFEELLNKDEAASIHHNDIHALAIEMFKVDNAMSPDILNRVFKLANTTYYNLRHKSHFSTDTIQDPVSFMEPN